jgi:diaminopimelate epimerase
MSASQIEIVGAPAPGFAINVGNPHCVFFLDSFENIEIEKVAFVLLKAEE